MCRWSIELSHYDFIIEHHKGSLNVVADALSRIQTNVVEFLAPVKDNWYLKLKTKILDLPDKYPLFNINKKIGQLVYNIVDENGKDLGN